MFGVVSNTMYPQYMLHARALLMEAMGFSVETLKAEYGIYAATLKMDLTFKTPMRPGDKFYTEVVITEMNRGTSCKVPRSLYVNRKCLQGGQPTCKDIWFMRVQLSRGGH
jgi:acyl dehydratase